MLNFKTYIVLFLLGVLSSIVLTPIMMAIAKRYSIIDKPGVRKIHKKPTPLLGGVAVAIGMWAPVGILLLYDNFVANAFRTRLYEVLLIFLSGLIMLIVGLIDDIKGLNARQKFAIQTPIALILVISGIQFGCLTVPGVGGIELGSLAPLITFVWIVGVCNAINLIDGLDGLAAGVVMFAAITNGVVAVINGNVMVGVLMISLAGACLGFLRYNFYPAKIFLGDSGSLFLGMTIAVTGILGSQKGMMAASLLIPGVILGYPIIDTLLAMVRRFIRGKSMFSGDNRHIHHRLIELVANHQSAVLIIYIGCVALSLLAIMIVMENNFGAAIGFIIIGFLLYLCLMRLGYIDILKKMLADTERYKFKAVEHLGKAAYYQVLSANSIEEINEQLLFICKYFTAPGYVFEMNGNSNLVKFKNVWFSDAQKEIDAQNGKLSYDLFDFEDTGLRLVFYHKEQNDDLHIEKRNLLGEIASAVNERIRRICEENGKKSNGNGNGSG
ncbi:MAG: glycosyltransferase family 4 protein [Verrucomicrobiia bacterium]